MEKLVYVLWGVIAAAAVLVVTLLFTLYSYAYTRGVEDTREKIALAAEACRDIVNMGLRDWQNTTGMGLTYQVQCQPLVNVAAGRESYDNGVQD